MKRFLLNFLLSLGVIGGVGVWYLDGAPDAVVMSAKQNNSKAGEGMRKFEKERTGYREAMALEFEKTRDPQLNAVPRERLYVALDYLQRQSERAALSKTTDIDNYNILTWTERGPNNVAGRTRTILFDKNDATNKRIFAAGAGGGIWRCNDITATTPVWTSINDQLANLAVTALAQDPSNPQIIYAGTGEGFNNADAIRGGGIWKSTDGGNTFNRLTVTANNQDFYYINDLLVDGSGNLFVATKGSYCNTNGGIQRSTNGGTSFSRVLGTNTGSCATSIMAATDLEIGPNGDLFAGFGGNGNKSKIYRAAAGQGASGTWTDITPTAAANMARVELAVAPSNANRLYALFDDGSGNCTLITTTTSALAATPTWANCTVPAIVDQGNNSNFTRGQAWYDLIAAVDPTNDQTVYIGGVDLLRSTDAGATWTQLTVWSGYDAGRGIGYTTNQLVHADQHALVFRPGIGNNGTLLSGNDGGIHMSTNANSTGSLPTWKARNNGYNVTQYYATAAHPTNTNYFLAGAQDNGTQRYNAAGMNSTTEVTGGDGAFTFISQTNGNNQITSYVYNTFYRSTNGGSSFTKITASTNTGRFINPAALDDVNNILYSAAGANALRRWSNVFGTVAATDLTLSLGSSQVSAVKVSPNTPTTVYVGTGSGNVYRITNANGTPATTQIATNLGPNGYVASIDVWKKKNAPIGDDSIVVALSSYGVSSVYLTANGSSATPTWTNLDDKNTLPDIPVRWVAFSPFKNQIIFLATEAGVFGNKNISGATTTWQQLNNGVLPQTRVDMIRFNSANQMVVATHGRGLWTSSTVQPLPFYNLVFNASASGQDALLRWSVEDNEKSIQTFTVQRMHEGESRFTDIARRPGSGSGEASHTDPQPDWERGKIFYRLKATERDGSETYSEVQTLMQTGTPEFITRVYPTLTTGEITVEVGASKPVSFMRITVVSINGTIVWSGERPQNTTKLDFSALPAGPYILAITDVGGQQRKVVRFEKQ